VTASPPAREIAEPARPAPPYVLPSAPVDLRAADQDRDTVAAVLAGALAHGCLTPEEHAERLEAAYTTRTLAELARLTQDLPAAPPEGGRCPSLSTDEPVVAVFSKLRCGGQWPVPQRSAFRACFGALVLDLRYAVFTRREVVIEASSLCGKIEMIVPDDAQVYDTGTALFGKRSAPGGRPYSAADGPVIRVIGRSVLGHVRVTRASVAYSRFD
jgi:Predicted membrane protein